MRYSYGEPTSVSAGDISRNFGLWQERAFNGPVIVTHHGRPRVVIVSAEQYATFRGDEFFQDEAGAEAKFETALSAVLDNTTEAFISFDDSLNIVAINRIFEATFGLISSHVVGRAFEDVFPRAAQSMIGEQLRRALKTGEVIEFASSATTEDGRYYSYRAFPYPSGVAVLIENRTADRESRVERQIANALKAALAESPFVCTVQLNVRGFIREADPAFVKLSGFTAEEFDGFRLVDLVLPKDRAEVTTILEDVLQKGVPHVFTAGLLVKGHSEQRVEISAAPILGETMCEGVVAVINPLVATQGVTTPA
jgi:prevent-host-death family protein